MDIEFNQEEQYIDNLINKDYQIGDSLDWIR